MNVNPIYKKLANIQGEIKGLKREKENKFQKYFYFTEEQAIKELKPLMETEKISVNFSDSEDIGHFFYEIQGKDHIIRYLKIATISDGENDNLIFHFWAMGQDTDISKAKGKAETYAIKYFLSKFFMIPIEDELDPDQSGNEKETKSTSPIFDPAKIQREKEKEIIRAKTISKRDENNELWFYCKSCDDNKKEPYKLYKNQPGATTSEIIKALEKHGEIIAANPDNKTN